MRRDGDVGDVTGWDGDVTGTCMLQKFVLLIMPHVTIANVGKLAIGRNLGHAVGVSRTRPLEAVADDRSIALDRDMDDLFQGDH